MKTYFGEFNSLPNKIYNKKNSQRGCFPLNEKPFFHNFLCFPLQNMKRFYDTFIYIESTIKEVFHDSYHYHL